MSTVIGWSILLVNVALAVDAGRRPYTEWRAARRNKNFWVAMLFFFGVLFLVPYLIRVRPRLQIAAIVAPPKSAATVGVPTPAVVNQPPEAEKGDPVTTAVVVENRSGTRRVQALNMTSDHREIPEPGVAGASAAYWLAGVGIFEGVAALLANDGTLTPGSEVGVVGTVAVAIGNGRLIGIVSPNEAAAPAVWVAVSLADLRVTTKGQIGVFKKRPSQIEVQYDGWEIDLGNVRRFDRSINQSQHGQEASLLRALTSYSQG